MAIYITRKMLTDFARQEANAAPFSVFRDLATSLAGRWRNLRQWMTPHCAISASTEATSAIWSAG
jgi:hypothetical protein